MTGIAFGPAEARAKKVIAGLAGGTGSGKTYSALELGTGLVADPAHRLFLIDTEFGRAAHYASAFKFQYGQLSPPFRPDSYINAINTAIHGGAECVIVDSLSHMWEGEDGLLDWHGDIALKMAHGNEDRAETYNFPAWRLPKQELQKFVLFLQRAPVHLILCLRAKEKSKMVKAVGQDGRSRTEIVTVGLQPIIDTATPYESTFLAMLSQEAPGVPRWTHKALASYLQSIFTDGPKQLSREHGRRLAQWCGTESPGSQHGNESHHLFDPGGPQPAPQPAREHTQPREPAATTAVGPVDWKTRGTAITAAFKAAQTMPELNQQEVMHREEIATFPPDAQSRVAKRFHEMREKLMAPIDDTDAAVADLEGRDGDERQEESLP